MEFSSKPSKSASRHRRKVGRIDFELFSKVAQDLASGAVTTAVGAETGVDPTQLQEGQSVFDNQGGEQVIVGDPDGTTDKVLMPKEQVDMGIPANADTVEDAELASQYSLQSPLAFNDAPHLQEFLKQAETIMDLPAAELGGGTPDLATSVEKDTESDGFRIGEPGYMEIIDTIQELKELGYDTVDILLMLGEKYDRDFSARVLAEARRKGLI